MPSISSDSKFTKAPSPAKASRPPSGSTQNQRRAGPLASPVSGASDFDPSSSFFPNTLPGSEAPTSSPPRVPSWRKWLWPLGALLLVAAASLYYVQRHAQEPSATDSSSAGTTAVDATPSAKAARPDSGVRRVGPQPTAQTGVTHTLPAGAPAQKITAVGTAQATRLVPASAEKAAARVPAMKDPLPPVTHTRRDTSAGEDR